MADLRILRGLPGSGKSFMARSWVANDPQQRARVNRDDLRAMMHDNCFIVPDGPDTGTERQIVEVRDAAIAALLKQGISVASDDTNLSGEVVEHLCELAIQCGGVPQVWDLTGVPVETCIARDADRRRRGLRSVGEPVIRQMWVRYLGGFGG